VKGVSSRSSPSARHRGFSEERGFRNWWETSEAGESHATGSNFNRGFSGERKKKESKKGDPSHACVAGKSGLKSIDWNPLRMVPRQEKIGLVKPDKQ